MNDGTWGENESKTFLFDFWRDYTKDGSERDKVIERYSSRLTKYFSNTAQRTRLETIEECESVLSEEREINEPWDGGFNTYREETLKKLAALKNTH